MAWDLIGGMVLITFGLAVICATGFILGIRRRQKEGKR